MIRACLLAISAIFIFMISEASATVYQYFDDEGTMIVTDNPYRLKKPRQQHRQLPYRNIKPVYIEDVAYDYYAVSGNTFNELVFSSNANGPFDRQDNRNYPAQTRWRLGWSYSFYSSYRIEGSLIHVDVQITNVQFVSDITVLLPASSEGTRLQPHELNMWELYLQILLEHENDHVRIIRDSSAWNTAEKSIAAIRTLDLPFSPAYDIDAQIKEAVEAETARIGHALIAEIKRRNDEYDRFTGHGVRHDLRESFFRNN